MVPQAQAPAKLSLVEKWTTGLPSTAAWVERMSGGKLRPVASIWLRICFVFCFFPVGFKGNL